MRIKIRPTESIGLKTTNLRLGNSGLTLLQFNTKGLLPTLIERVQVKEFSLPSSQIHHSSLVDRGDRGSIERTSYQLRHVLSPLRGIQTTSG